MYYNNLWKYSTGISKNQQRFLEIPHTYSWKKKNKKGEFEDIKPDSWVGENFIAYAVSAPLANIFIIEPPLSESTAEEHKLIGFNAEPSGEITIPEGVTEIKESLFNHCTRITKIHFPTTLKLLKSNFNHCTGLQGELDLSMCSQLKKLRYSIFSYCPSITSVKEPLIKARDCQRSV